jgi:hypothetical protein
MPLKPFDARLSGWLRRGAAQFSLDPEQTRLGRPAARISITPETPLNYQQIYRDFRQDIRPGDELQATVWVRSRDIRSDPGAYMALEFLGEGDARVGIAHSATGARNGGSGWEKLTASGIAPSRTKAIRLSLILHAHGTAWFSDPEVVRTARMTPWKDLGSAVRRVTVRTRKVAHPAFGGVGFHAFQHSFHASREEMDQVIYKRWRELNPSFVRVNDEWNWDRARWDQAAEHLRRMKETGAQVYVTTWNPAEARTPEARAEYAKKVADNLEYLVKTKGLTNIRYYCMTNELSLNGWGALRSDLPLFKAYHEALYREFQRRNLKIGLLATDASPIDFWWTIEWAAQNMDSITAVYGGHHYINDYPLEDERFYPWFLSKLEWGAGIARSRGKNFILGEFGAKQDGRTVNGVLMDACIYWDTPQEPLVGLQVSEATIAAMNAGVYSLGYWTYMDFPDDYSRTYKNKWGLFKCSGEDRSTRSLYYAYGLLTKFFRGPATVFRVECSDPRLRVAAIQHHGSKTWSIAVVNRNRYAVPLQLTIDGAPVNGRFRKYVYDPQSVPQNPFGDLQPPSGTAIFLNGKMTDRVGGYSLAVYTSAYDDRAPAPVQGVVVDLPSASGTRIRWQANREPDLCYYRIYRGDTPDFKANLSTQIGVTVATEFVDRSASDGPKRYYRVRAVDQSGNVSLK